MVLHKSLRTRFRGWQKTQEMDLLGLHTGYEQQTLWQQQIRDIIHWNVFCYKTFRTVAAEIIIQRHQNICPVCTK